MFSSDSLNRLQSFMTLRNFFLLGDKDHYGKYFFISRLNRYGLKSSELMKRASSTPLILCVCVSDFYVNNVFGKHRGGFNRFEFNHKMKAFFSFSSVSVHKPETFLFGSGKKNT